MPLVNEQQQPVPERRTRLVILGICSMSLLIVGLDSTIVNIALPAIHRSFHSSLSGLQWTIDAYTLVLASLLMLSGSSADRIGRRRVFQIGLVLFSLGSLLCAVAPSLGALIAARVLQAIGGSMLNPVAMSIIRNVFVDPRERARAIGVWGGVIGISMALGPVVGGALVDSVGWRAVFIVNVPIGILAILLTALFVPESKADRPRRIDPVGQVLVIAALATLTYAIIEAPGAGWLSPQTLGLFGASVACFASLVAYELHRREPLLEIRFFRSAPFSGATAIAVAMFAAMGGFLFLNTLYLQEVRGLSPLVAGLYTLPMAGLMLVVAPLTGRFVGNRGTRLPLVGGGLALAASGAILTQLTPHTPFAVLIVAYILFGLGSGMINPPITNTAVSGMPPSQAGVAAAVASTGRQVGQTLGVAVLGALAGSGAAGAIGGDFTASTHVSWWIVVALGLGITVLGFITTTAWADATAGRTADLFRDPSRTGGDGSEAHDEAELVAG
ncbi:MAG TPA: MFS transporter [Solirubrobacteraceae bacterium]|nr:MFS transporter [Solirubrobacteraceae bacterium]